MRLITQQGTLHLMAKKKKNTRPRHCPSIHQFRCSPSLPWRPGAAINILGARARLSLATISKKQLTRHYQNAILKTGKYENHLQ